MPGYPITILGLGIRRFEGSYSFREHVHVHHQCYLVLAGAVDYRVEDRLHRITAGQAVVVASGLTREPRAAAPAGLACIITFASPWPELGRPHGVLVRLDAATRAEAEALATGGAQPGHVQAIRVHRVLLGLLGEPMFARLDRLPDGARGQADARLVEQLEAVFAANPDNPFTLAEMSLLAGVSPAQLGRLFRRHRGCAPVARHRELRLQAALHRLRGGASVTVVAQETGFASSQHLATAFHHRFGLPPSQAARLPDQQVYTPRSRRGRAIRADAAGLRA